MNESIDSTTAAGVASQPNKLDILFKSYFEGKMVNIPESALSTKVIWLRPNIVAPMGFTLWAAGLIRKISILPKSEYLVHKKNYTLKSY
jgi:hypothetical protein